MSYTEIYGFDKEGNAYSAGDVKNAWRGAMAIWGIMEKRYLPPYRPAYVPEWVPDDEIEVLCGYKLSRCSAIMDKNAMPQIWNLVDNEKVSEVDKIVLFTTFDWYMVKRDNIQKVISAFNEFKGETSLKEQAIVLEKLLKDENCIAVGWNQTSVNGDTWESYSYDEENDENIPYNCLKQKEHYWLFDKMK